MMLFFLLKFNRTIKLNFIKNISFFLFPLIILLSCQKYKTIYINNKKLYIEIADTEQKIKKGLMFREKLEEDAGMLFIFDRNKVLTFWMKNTFIPLSIAFINSNYEIVHITDMSPLDEETYHSSIYPIKYAIEVNQGWFKKYNIKIGDKIKGLE